MLLQQSPFRGEDEDEIYDAILADEPLYPIHMPRDSVSILQKLLTREPEFRLGSGPTDAQEIMSHAFFRNINWDDIYHKRVPAPFMPTISNATDTSNFDSEFTSVTPVLTPVQSGKPSLLIVSRSVALLTLPQFSLNRCKKSSVASPTPPISSDQQPTMVVQCLNRASKHSNVVGSMALFIHKSGLDTSHLIAARLTAICGLKRDGVYLTMYEGDQQLFQIPFFFPIKRKVNDDEDMMRCWLG